MILEFKVKCRQGFDRGKVKRVRRGLSPAWCSSSFDKVGCFLGLGKLGCSLGQQWYSGMLLTTMVLMFCLALVFTFGSTEQPLMIFVIFVALSNWPWSWWNFVQDIAGVALFFYSNCCVLQLFRLSLSLGKQGQSWWTSFFLGPLGSIQYTPILTFAKAGISEISIQEIMQTLVSC